MPLSPMPAAAELQRFGDLVYAAALRQARDQHDARDIAQAVFVIALQKAKTGHLPEESRMAGWLLKTTHNAVKESRRREKMRSYHEPQAAAMKTQLASPDPDDETLLAALDGALLKLSDLDRELVARRYLQNQPVNRLAASLRIPENTASQRLRRALEKLRKLLRRQGVIAPAATLTALLLTESAKCAPISLLTTATTGAASANAAAIAHGATRMMNLVAAKTAGLAACALIALLVVGAGLPLIHTVRAQAPSTPASPPPSPSTTAATSTPGPKEAEQLFMDALHLLESAQHIEVEATREHRSSATEAVRPDDQADVTQITTTSHAILLERPNNLSWTIVHDPSRPRIADGEGRIVILFAKSSFLNAFQFTDDGPYRGSVGEMKRMTTDDILRSNECFVHVVFPELADLLHGEARSRFFQYATDWEWLGAASDNEAKVWRVKFTDARATPMTWEVWISQNQPHRFLRIISSRPSSIGISRIKPGEDFNGVLNPSNSTSTEYKTFEQTQVTFTKWDTTAPIPATAFQRPAGEFKDRAFEENHWRFRVGDIVGLPALTDTAGNTVDLSRHAGPKVLFFWFAVDGSVPSKMAAVKAIADEFARKGVEVYGINDQNTPEQIDQAQAKDSAAHMVTLVDHDHETWKNFSVTYDTTTLVIGADGKLLFREPIEGRADLGRLRAALQKVTASPPDERSPKTAP